MKTCAASCPPKRTDFPGGSAEVLAESLRRLASLEGNYKVYPGHEEDTTLDFEREKVFHPVYKGKPLDATYRLDFIYLDLLIIECKAVEKLIPEHRAQLFNYMRLTKVRSGLLVNFAPKNIEIVAGGASFPPKR